MASIQVGASFAKQLFPAIGPEMATMLRNGLSALILVVIWRPWRLKLNRKAWVALLLYGVSLGLMNLIFYLSIQRIPIGLAVALEFVGPLSVALLASRRPADFLWALLAGVGIYLVLPISGISTALDTWGVIYALVAGGLWGLYIVFGKHAGGLVPGGGAAALGMCIAALTVLPSGLMHADSRLASWSIWAQAAIIAVLSSALPYSVEMMALRKIPAKTFGILMSLEPALAALSGFLLLGEELTALQWTAIMSVIVASAGSSLSARDGAAGQAQA